MLKKILLLTVFKFYTYALLGQLAVCGTPISLPAVENVVSVHLNTADIITIPVVVHVVHSTPLQNISEAQIHSQIAVLNQDFRRMNADTVNTPAIFRTIAADSRIEFCLATQTPDGIMTNGITRTATNQSNFNTNDEVKSNSTGGQDAWDASQYLNIWVAPLVNGLFGYAQFPNGNPTTDGIVIDYRFFGTTGTAMLPFNLGRRATHEVGHWLNLSHIWGTIGCNSDDGIVDTPTSSGPSFVSAPCTFPNRNTCIEPTNDLPDMFQNFMDNTPDVCMNLFTVGQSRMMRTQLETGGARFSIQQSMGCSVANPILAATVIPTFNEWGMLLYVLVLLNMNLWTIARAEYVLNMD